ncbi:MAG: molybdate ABC transporter substrate-binding protein [Planctomycetota bacterium]|jgi:molybdate transport system substrate-binding protein
MRCSLPKSATTTSCSLALLGLALGACTERDPRPQVFVAASLYRAVTDVVREQGLEVRFATAASSTLARQIEHGAGAGVFLSANREWMDYLANRRLLAADTRKTLVRNRLALVARSAMFLRDRMAASRVAMGDPNHVPVGQYAKAYLQQQGQWEHWRDRILPTGDAPAAVRLVQLGEADLAIVYGTDAQASGLEWTALGQDIAVTYECAILRAGDSPAVRRIYQALTSKGAARIYARHGFVPDAR